MSFPFYFMGDIAAILFLLQLFFLRETKPWEDKPQWLKLEYYECWKHHQGEEEEGRDDDGNKSNTLTPCTHIQSVDGSVITIDSGSEHHNHHLASTTTTPAKMMSPMDQAKDMGLGPWSKKNKWFIPTLVCLCLAAFAGQ